MKINGKHTDATKFAFDGCHRFYIIENQEDEDYFIANEYIIYPMTVIKQVWSNSCGLRYISNYVEQLEVAVFEE